MLQFLRIQRVNGAVGELGWASIFAHDTASRAATTPEIVGPRLAVGRFANSIVNDTYAVIAYYLAHRNELDAYILRREEAGARLRQEWEAKYPPKVTRAELERRLAARKADQDEIPKN